MVQTNVRSDTEIFESMQDEFSSGLLVTVEVMRALRVERLARLQTWERYREEWKTQQEAREVAMCSVAAEEAKAEPKQAMSQSAKAVVDCLVVAEYAYKGLK
jgi:hypothetical protein